MKKKIIFGVLMVAIVGALVGIGTWAIFTDVETSKDNIFVAGSMDLKVNGDDDPLAKLVWTNTDCIKPGDEGSTVVTMENIGCVNGKADLLITVIKDDENVALEPELNVGDVPDVLTDDWDGELCSKLEMRVTADLESDGGYEVTVFDWAKICCDGPGGIAGFTWWFDNNFDAGDKITLLFEWRVPLAVGNIIMTDICQFDIEFSLHQRPEVLPQYDLTVVSDGCCEVTAVNYGTVVANGSDTFEDIDEYTWVQVVAEPPLCCKFDQWLIGGVPAGDVNPINIQMDADKTVTAECHTQKWDLTVDSVGCCSVEKDGQPIVTPEAQVYDCCTNVTLTAIAPAGCTFDRWEVNGVPDANQTINVHMGQDTTAVVYCTGDVYTLTVNNDGCCTLEVDGVAQAMPFQAQYPWSTMVDLEAITPPCCVFDEWTGDVNGASSTANPLTVHMDADRTITLHCYTQMWTLTLTSDGCCDIEAFWDPDGYQYVDPDTQEVIPGLKCCTMVHLVPSIPECCVVDEWLVDGVPTPANPDGSLDIHMGENRDVLLVCHHTGWTLTLVSVNSTMEPPGCCDIEGDLGIYVPPGGMEIIPGIECCTWITLWPSLPEPPPYCIFMGWVVDGVPTAPMNPDGSIEIHMGQDHTVLIVCDWCPTGGWDVDYQAYGQMLLYTSIGGAPLGPPIPSPATCNWTMNYGCAEMPGSLFRALSVPAASWYWFPFCAPVSSGPPLNWVTIDVTLDADASGQLFTMGSPPAPGSPIDVDVFSDTCDTVNAMWDCTGDPNATGKCLCGLCSPCDGTTVLADCVVGNCVGVGDGATSATEIAGSALLYMPLTAHVYSAMVGPTDPYDNTTWGNEVLTVPLNFQFTTEMAYATMHDSALDGFPGVALDAITLPTGPGMPFIALGGFAPYVATAGVMVAAGGLVDGVALGAIELDALYNMMLSMAPWTLAPTIKVGGVPAIPGPTLGDTVTVDILVTRIGGPPGPIPVAGFIMDLFDGSYAANLGLQMTGMLAIGASQTLTWANVWTTANAGIYMLSAGATTIMVFNPIGLTPSLGSGFYGGNLGVPLTIDTSVSNPGVATEQFTISLSIKDAAALEVHTDRATVTVPTGSTPHNFSWTPTATGAYTIDVVDPVTGVVLATAGCFISP